MKITICSSSEFSQVEIQNVTEIKEGATAKQALAAFLQVMHENNYAESSIQEAIDFYSDGGFEEGMNWDVLLQE